MLDTMSVCTHQNLLDWFLCEHAQRRPADFWYTSGHPCKFAYADFTGQVFCTFDNPERTKAGQE